MTKQTLVEEDEARAEETPLAGDEIAGAEEEGARAEETLLARDETAGAEEDDAREEEEAGAGGAGEAELAGRVAGVEAALLLRVVAGTLDPAVQGP